MEDKKIYMILEDEKGETLGRYNKFESVQDLYIYLGKLINMAFYEIKVKHLYYFDFDTSSYDKEYFKIWLESVGNNGLLCHYMENKQNYYIRLKIE